MQFTNTLGQMPRRAANRLQALLWLAAFGLALYLGGCKSKSETDPPAVFHQRGEVVSDTLLRSYTVAELDSIYQANGLLGQTASYPVKLYRVKYRTIDPFGQPTTASGALALPEGIPTAGAPLFSYQHGTIAKRTQVPSFRGTEQLLAVAMAGYGYVGIAPDYLGLGTSDFTYHPYIHAETEATAVVDMLRASRRMAARESVPLNGKVYLTGYSQGGHATMAAHRRIQLSHSDEFTVTAAAPMAGPYDLSGVMVDVMLSDQPYRDPSYLPFLLLGYNNIYNMYADLAEVFLPEYLQNVIPMFDGNASNGEINAVLPAVPKLIVQPALLDDFAANPNHIFRRYLAENNTYTGWTPQAPQLMCHCTGDEAVPIANSDVAYQAFLDQGTNPALLERFNAGNLNHDNCALVSILRAQTWFRQFD